MSTLLVVMACGCAGPLAFFPITPLLSAVLSTRGPDTETSKAIAALQKKGDWAGLVKLAQGRLLRNPTDSDAWVLLGYSLLQQNNYPDAIQALTRATNVNPEDIDGWNLLADAQRRAGQPGASTRTLERAIAVDPTSPITRLLMGEAYRENGDPERAQLAYQETQRISPQMAPAWFGLGTLLLQTGSPAEIQAAAENLQRLDPGLAKDFARLRAESSRQAK